MTPARISSAPQLHQPLLQHLHVDGLIIFVVVVGLLATVVILNSPATTNWLTKTCSRMISISPHAVRRLPPGSASGCLARLPTGLPIDQPGRRSFIDQIDAPFRHQLQFVPHGFFALSAYGPYIKQLPVNPFSNSSDVLVVPNNQPMPTCWQPRGAGSTKRKHRKSSPISRRKKMGPGIPLASVNSTPRPLIGPRTSAQRCVHTYRSPHGLGDPRNPGLGRLWLSSAPAYQQSDAAVRA